MLITCTFRFLHTLMAVCALSAIPLNFACWFLARHSTFIMCLSSHPNQHNRNFKLLQKFIGTLPTKFQKMSCLFFPSMKEWSRSVFFYFINILRELLIVLGHFFFSAFYDGPRCKMVGDCDTRTTWQVGDKKKNLRDKGNAIGSCTVYFPTVWVYPSKLSAGACD